MVIYIARSRYIYIYISNVLEFSVHTVKLLRVLYYTQLKTLQFKCLFYNKFVENNINPEGCHKVTGERIDSKLIG